MKDMLTGPPGEDPFLKPRWQLKYLDYTIVPNTTNSSTLVELPRHIRLTLEADAKRRGTDLGQYIAAMCVEQAETLNRIAGPDD